MNDKLSYIKKSKKVGILIHDNVKLFSNGINQNAYFLFQCLELAGYKCQFLCYEPNPSNFSYKSISLKQITTDEKIFDPFEYHTIVSVTRCVSKELYFFLKQNKIGVVSLVCGNNYMYDQEEFLKEPVVKTYLGGITHIDEQWVIPSYDFALTYLELICKKPAFIVPHLWSPEMVQFCSLEFFGKPESSLFYCLKPRMSKKINIITLEPNNNLFKTAWLPIVAGEKLHKDKPDIIEYIYVFNFPENNHAYDMVDALDVCSKVRKFKRKSLAEIMLHFNNDSDHMPIFVSHQVLNSLNYLYYELLYYGYPLVHNSTALDGCGYKYSDNNITECVEQILYAVKHHDKQLETYKDKANEYLKRVDPLNSEVQKTFDQMIAASMKNCLEANTKILCTSKAFVINLDRRIDRYKLFQKNHPFLHAHVERISAVDGKKIELTSELVHLFRNNTFKWMKGVMGCALSHYNLWKQLADSKDSEYLILEDDVKCTPDFLAKFSDIFQHIPKDADLLYLGGVLPQNLDAYKTCVEPVNKYIGKLKDNPYCGTTNSFFHFGTYCYVLTNSGAKKIISIIKKIGISHGIDIMLGNFVNEMKIYVSLPLVATVTQFDDQDFINANMTDVSKTSTMFDSDICNQTDCFMEEEINHVIETPLLTISSTSSNLVGNTLVFENTLKQNSKTDLALPDSNQVDTIKVYFHNFWPGFLEKIDPINVDFFEKFLCQVFKTKVVIGDKETSTILVESVFGKESALPFKQWSKTFLFLGEPYFPTFAHLESYSCILGFTETKKNFVCLPLFMPYILSNPLSYKPVADVPDKFACTVISNPNGNARNAFLDYLEKWGSVSYGGNFRNNIGRNIQGNYKSNVLIDYYKQFRFVITMENTKESHYVTEKIINGFRAGVIPVYWGSPNIHRYFHEDRFLTLHDDSIESIKTLVHQMATMSEEEYIRRINSPIFKDGFGLNDVVKDTQRCLQ